MFKHKIFYLGVYKNFLYFKDENKYEINIFKYV